MLTLATPGSSAGGSDGHDESSWRGDAVMRQKISRDFGFPYESAYGIQIELMQAVFGAIEARKIGVFESPTGTGKSLSLICAAATWLQMDRQRALHGQIHDNEKDCSETDAGEPDWVRKHTLERHRKDLLRCEDDLKQRISVARKNLARRKEHIKRQSQSEISKRRRDEAIEEAESDDEFLLESQSQSGDVHALSDDPTSLLSPAVRALMEKTGSRIGASSQRGGKRPFYARHHDKDDDDEEPETTPKIIYASRTHSQISQFVGELKKTKFAREVDVSSAGGQHAGAVDTHLTIRSTSLGSRKQMCIHPKVQRTGAHRGIEAMNEKCLDLMKAKGKGDSPRCEFLPSHDEAGQLKMLDYRDASFAEVSDIEDLVALGKTMKTCPYFGARGSARYAHVVTVPYNLLLNKTARATLNVNLAGSIVIIDEAHNLIDTILSSHSIAVSSKQIERCIAGAESYMARFGSRLKGANEVNLKKLIKILKGLETFCSEMQDSGVRSSDNVTSSMTTSDLLKRIGGNVDQVNLLELEAWLRETKVAHKIAGYAEKQRSKELQIFQATNAFKDLEKGSSASAMISVESLLLSLVDRDLNGRIFLSSAGAADGDKTCKVPPEVVIKYQLLNPADVFADLAKDARSIILAGGTMEPFSDFETQLFTDASRERLLRFSCGHIIPPSNLMAAVVCKGATGKQLEFKFDARSNPALLDELTKCLINFCNVIPSGVVVFVPSYAFLDQLVARWKSTNAITRIEARKKIFYEPKQAGDVDKVLHAYAAAVDSPQPGRTGALILAVVGAKLSEGINFSDQLGRAVIMVGMPFANAASPELAERMRYVRSLPANAVSGKDAGQELYINLCMKAVNQSIGRAIRHQHDYAALVFLDVRYSRPDIRARLPGWIRESVRVHESFGPSVGALSSFFRGKKTLHA